MWKIVLSGAASIFLNTAQQLALLLGGRSHPKRADVDVEQIALASPLSDSRPPLEGRCLCRYLALQLRDLVL